MRGTSEIVEYWKSHAQYDMDTADSLFAGKRYPYCLFMCHLAIEKMLKGIIVMQTNEHAPYTHNLIELADKSSLKLSEAQKTLVSELNEFNLEARYPDWQKDFYQTATAEFTGNYLTKTKDLFIWLQK